VAEDPVEVVTGVFRPVADGTTPPAGTAVEEGTVVVLRMAVPRRVRMPDLRGRTPAIATAVLGQVGLRLTDRDPEAVASSARPGTIVRQSPTAPREVTIGSTVAVTVAEPWSVEVPDLDGLSVDAVPRRLQAAAAPVLEKLGRPGDAAGLTLGAVTPAASTRDIGTVVGQRPDAGESRFLYGTVDVSVAARPATVVPDVRRLHQLAATARLTEADLVLGGVRRRPSRTVAVGGVLEQRPLPADEVDPGTAVDVVVSSGQRAVVPNVLGRPVPVAIETITSAGFGVAPVRRDAGSSDSVPGTVVFQVPAPGSSVVAGTEVELTVAVGVPRVIGRTFADAVHELESLGYVVARVDEPVTEGSGTVLVQDPQAGTPADAGTVVTLVVGVSTRVFVPDLTGLDIVDATDRLTETGLVLAGTSTVPADGREGLVVEQTPIADEEVVRGTGVSVVLGAPVVVAVIVPAVVGLTQEAARQALAAANLVIEVRELRPSGEVAPGVVMEQEPVAGSARPPGSVVAVVVATEGVVTVPAVVGLGLAEAERLVVAARLHIDAGPIRPGTLVVTSQRPAAGAQAVIGSTVVVTVQGIVAAPALEGLLITVARATAQRMGLTLAESLEFGGIRPGLVLSQDPLAGEPVPVGGTIAVTVSRFGRPGSEFDLDIFERPEVVVTRPDRIGPVIRPGPIFERPGLLDRIVRPDG
nr:PASTA domain-containing protein [Acidimicrobiia bacterium]